MQSWGNIQKLRRIADGLNREGIFLIRILMKHFNKIVSRKSMKCHIAIMTLKEFHN